jgi:cytidylate kinase
MILNSPFVITISRQFGSGGAYIGKQLAKNLDFFYADREIINMAAKQLSVLEADLQSRDEKVSSFWQSFLQSYTFVNPYSYNASPQINPTDKELFNAEKEVIEHIAKERSAIIIGRCGSHILREHPNHFSIFLHADLTFRKDRVQKLYNISKAAAREMITQKDKERTFYHNTFTDMEWQDARQYHISLDTSKIGLDKSVELIMKCLE